MTGSTNASMVFAEPSGDSSRTTPPLSAFECLKFHEKERENAGIVNYTVENTLYLVLKERVSYLLVVKISKSISIKPKIKKEGWKTL
jgi:hypothetical protein